MLNGTKVTTKYNRCLSFTLPNGKTVDVKVLGDKAAAAADAKLLLATLQSTK